MACHTPSVITCIITAEIPPLDFACRLIACSIMSTAFLDVGRLDLLTLKPFLLEDLLVQSVSCLDLIESNNIL